MIVFSKNSAFKPWKNQSLENEQDKQDELMRKYAKRLFLILKTRNTYPYINNGKVVLLLYTTDEIKTFNVKKTINKLNRTELYIFIENFFGKEAFYEKTNIDYLWYTFRKNFFKNR